MLTQVEIGDLLVTWRPQAEATTLCSLRRVAVLHRRKHYNPEEVAMEKLSLLGSSWGIRAINILPRDFNFRCIHLISSFCSVLYLGHVLFNGNMIHTCSSLALWILYAIYENLVFRRDIEFQVFFDKLIIRILLLANKHLDYLLIVKRLIIADHVILQKLVGQGLKCYLQVLLLPAYFYIGLSWEVCISLRKFKTFDWSYWAFFTLWDV